MSTDAELFHATLELILLRVPPAFRPVLERWAWEERPYGYRAVLDKLENLVGDLLPAIEAHDHEDDDDGRAP